MHVTSPELTAEQLLGLDAPGQRFELHRGRLIVREPAGLRHGHIGASLAYRLRRHLDDELAAGRVATRRGLVFGPDTGFILARAPDTVRAPDVAYVRAELVPSPLADGFAEYAPDLVIEVRSPNDRPGFVIAKVGEYLAAGTQLVWVVDPQRAVVTTFASDGRVQEHERGDVVSAEPVVPGFRLPVDTILGG